MKKNHILTQLNELYPTTYKKWKKRLHEFCIIRTLENYIVVNIIFLGFTAILKKTMS